MNNINELMAEGARTGKNIKVNPANKITSARRKMFSNIQELSGNDPQQMFEKSVKIVNDYIPNVRRYVLSQNEIPNNNTNNLIKQAYQLRCNQINNYSKATGLSNGNAQILLESEESESDNYHAPDKETYLGALSAPIGIVASYLENSNNFDGNTETDYFIDPAIVTGLFSTVGSKISASELKRAAMNKPAGLVGLLSSGGTSTYDKLRAFLNNPANIQYKNGILNGQINDISQIPLFSTGGYINNNTGGLGGFTNQTINEIKKQKIKQAIPYIIIGVAVLILIIVLILKKRGNK